MRIVAEAAAGYASAGYLTVVEGILIPGWFFEPLRDALQGAGHTVADAVLRAPLEVCLARVQEREGEPPIDAAAIEQIWRSFADLGDLEEDVIEVGDLGSPEVADLLERIFGGGREMTGEALANHGRAHPIPAVLHRLPADGDDHDTRHLRDPAGVPRPARHGPPARAGEDRPARRGDRPRRRVPVGRAQAARRARHPRAALRRASTAAPGPERWSCRWRSRRSPRPAPPRP